MKYNFRSWEELHRSTIVWWGRGSGPQRPLGGGSTEQRPDKRRSKPGSHLGTGLSRQRWWNIQRPSKKSAWPTGGSERRPSNWSTVGWAEGDGEGIQRWPRARTSTLGLGFHSKCNGEPLESIEWGSNITVFCCKQTGWACVENWPQGAGSTNGGPLTQRLWEELALECFSQNSFLRWADQTICHQQRKASRALLAGTVGAASRRPHGWTVARLYSWEWFCCSS